MSSMAKTLMHLFTAAAHAYAGSGRENDETGHTVAKKPRAKKRSRSGSCCSAKVSSAMRPVQGGGDGSGSD